MERVDRTNYGQQLANAEKAMEELWQNLKEHCPSCLEPMAEVNRDLVCKNCGTTVTKD